MQCRCCLHTARVMRRVGDVLYAMATNSDAKIYLTCSHSYSRRAVTHLPMHRWRL